MKIANFMQIKSLPLWSLIGKISVLPILAFFSCAEPVEQSQENTFRHHVIFDTDANNEIDDQHALAYLLFSGDIFAVEGVTVNATSGPGHGISGHIDGQYDEAKRIMQLCAVYDDIPLFKGANGSFEEIKGTWILPNLTDMRQLILLLNRP
jgi:purine nucleosidase